MKIIGAIVMIAAAIYGVINIQNGTYRRSRRPAVVLGLILLGIAIIYRLLSGQGLNLKW